MCSFLPQDESDRCNLSRQGESSHRWLHAFREQALVEIVERSLSAAGHRRRTLEDGFHIVIMILIAPTNLLGFLAALELSGNVTMLCTVAHIDRQTAVGPQLPLGSGKGSGLARSVEQPESDRCKESGAVILSPSVSGCQPTDPAALLGAKLAEHRAVGRRTRPAGATPASPILFNHSAP